MLTLCMVLARLMWVLKVIYATSWAVGFHAFLADVLLVPTANWTCNWHDAGWATQSALNQAALFVACGVVKQKGDMQHANALAVLCTYAAAPAGS